MGVVWRAVQQSTNREVALKVLTARAFGAEQDLARFQRELDLMARLEHPHIARVYDGGRSGGVYYYAMELVEGLPLDAFIKSAELPRRQVVALMRAVCKAVQFAHQKGVIHRDLKPGNILVDKRGRPRVLDFGLAKVIDGPVGATVTLDGAIAGTPQYMSPEQAAGRNSELDTRSDVYSLGVILFHLLSGGFPHDPTGGVFDVIRRVAEDEPARLTAVVPDAGRDLSAVLDKALAREPERRYDAAGGLAADLGRYLAAEPVSAQPITVQTVLWRVLRRHRAAGAAAAVVAAALAGTVVWAYARVAAERDAAVAARNDAADAREAERRQRVEVERQRETAVAARRDATAGAEVAEREAARARASERTAQDERARAESSAAAARASAAEADKERANAVASGRAVDVERLQTARAQEQVRRLMPGQQVRDGDARLADGDPAQALLLFAAALRGDLAAGDAAAAARDRLRIASALESLPRPGQWPADAAPAPRPAPPGRSLRVAGRAVEVFEAGSSRPVVVLQGRDDVDEASWSPDGTRVLTRGGFSLQMWDGVSGTAVTPRGGAQSYDPIEPRAFSADGSKVLLRAAGDYSVLDLKTGVTQRLPHSKSWAAAAVGPDGALAATTEDEDPAAKGGRSVHLWDVRAGRDAVPPLAHETPVTAVAFTPDGTRLATCGRDKRVRVWSTADGRLVATLDAGDGYVDFAAYSPDGRRLLLAGLSDAVVVDAATGRPVGPKLAYDPAPPSGRKRTARLGLCAVAFTPGDDRVVTCDRSLRARAWDVATGRPLSPAVALGERPRTIGFSPDGSRVVAAGPTTTHRGWWFPVAAADAAGLAARRLDGASDLRAAAIDEAGRRVATVGRVRNRASGAYGSEDLLQVWDASTGRPIGPAVSVGYSTEVAFLGDGPEVACGGSVVSTNTGSRIRPATRPFERRAYNPRGTRYVAWVWSVDQPAKELRAYDAVTGQPAGPAADCTLSIDAASCSGDGTRVLIRARSAVQVFDAASGRFLAPPVEGGGRVACAAMSPDGTRVATGDQGGLVRLFDILGRPAEATRPGPTLRHDRPVSVATFSPDGSRLLTVEGDDGGTVRVWDAGTGAALTSRRTASTSKVVGAAFGPGGDRVLCVHADGSVGTVDLAPDARPADDLRALAELLTRSKIDDAGAIVALSPPEWDARWDGLRRTQPALFGLAAEVDAR